jgi:hypothetical protein
MPRAAPVTMAIRCTTGFLLSGRAVVLGSGKASKATALSQS